MPYTYVKESHPTHNFCHCRDIVHRSGRHAHSVDRHTGCMELHQIDVNVPWTANPTKVGLLLNRTFGSQIVEQNIH